MKLKEIAIILTLYQISSISFYKKIKQLLKRFVFDGDAYSVTPKEYLLTITEEGVEPVYHHSKKVLQCVGAFSSLDFENMDHYYILGDIFLTRYYSVFDKGKRRIGLASIN